MEHWHSKDIGDGVAAFAPAQKLHDQFVAISMAAGVPSGFGVFSYYDLRANMVTWYFSPEASDPGEVL